MLEPIKCSCNNSIGDKYLLYVKLLAIMGDSKKNEILNILGLRKNCCRLKVLNCAIFSSLF
jgi:DNA-directed RNA polymerase subunit N (RpoN/RPB10)